MISWLHRPIIFDIRTRSRSVPSIIEIKDLQAINITLRILYRPRAELLPKIFCKFGFKICCTKSQFDAIELITQRILISQRVSELLTERAAQFGLLLDDISITHLSFRPEFTSAVELKQVAQQDVEKQRFLVEKTEQSRQANVIAVEGDARTADLIGKALDEVGDGLIELLRIEAAEGIANQLSKSRNSVYLPHGPQMLLNIIGEIFTDRREKIGVRDECLELVPAGNVPSQVATAHFQLVLSRDQGFSRRRLFTVVLLINQYPIGSILLENPYYGLRKPPDQSCSSLLYVTNLYIMGEVLILETLMLLHWCQKMKLTFTKWPDPPSRQFYENKASHTFYDYLHARNQSIDSNKIVLSLIKDMMRLLMDEFTSLYNYSRSVQ
ncbi:unnamed protein product [Rotaria sordida]|uniref:Band 7 domain-containing protein n=4 Tax=Rotaria sordida TaxID=392033 RepID=A0A815Y9U4_9BILA|nr:unnamed protein product [Rotaria sordida]CAF1567442.1 unnamed protein product [Rotaria sordida]